MTPLRICMLTTFYPPYSFGGDAVGIQRLSRALVRQGHDVTVVHEVNGFLALSPDPDPGAPVRDVDEGVKVVRLRARAGVMDSLLVHQLGRPVAHADFLRGLVADPTWDVVNYHNVSLLGGPGLLRMPTTAVTLYMAHEHWLVCPTHVLWRHGREPCPARECIRCQIRYRRPPQLWRHTSVLERAMAGMDAVIAMSRFSRKKHREFGFTRDMEVLPYFLPPAPPGAVDEASPHRRPYFFFAGRLERIKGLDDVIPVFRSYPEADLLIAGDGDDAEHLKALARGMPNVRFLGRLPPEQLAGFYRHAIAGLVPSICFETFGIVAIEAFRQGTPVIVREIGPLPELAEGAGEVFASANDLRGCLERLQRDPARRNRLGAHALERFRTQWSEEVVVPAYLEIVQRAAERTGKRRHMRPAGAEAA